MSQVTLEAQQHQDLPFQTLSEFPNLARIPLNRATFILQNTPFRPLELAGIAVKPLKKEQETADFELFLSMREILGELNGQLQYKTNLFEESTIAQMVANFQILLESIVANPAQPLDSLSVKVKNNTFVSESDKSRQESPVTFIAPRNELERQLTKIWEKVLGIQPISITDNFFDFGGHSMLGVRLFSEIEKIFGKNIPLVTLFQTPTIEQLASIFHAQVSSGSHSCIVPIKPDGCQPPFFFIGSIGYAQKLAPYLISPGVIPVSSSSGEDDTVSGSQL
ncbi:phosphopantetheine-binding protein [Limnofasciculus baicalensis]|uniref:Phosphopantetheine-binding protein n=1 Tax=Limnofasciculus baicalensis BBK-W-15 TaxID=2699891 RepID=A0AAE3GRB2_9CYAN|nr:phosphopantetheine-binding protein [Limnofasciculus baicalensis]MCP2728423.1 phosphopantetheine-binding protein [Limnofasciculus baicalensis BBK-W-15]